MQEELDRVVAECNKKVHMIVSFSNQPQEKKCLILSKIDSNKLSSKVEKYGLYIVLLAFLALFPTGGRGKY